MVLVFVLTQTVSHSFPKLCAALQRKFGTVDATPSSRGREDGDEGVAATRCWVCSAVMFSANFAPAMQLRLPSREVECLCGITHRT